MGKRSWFSAIAVFTTLLIQILSVQTSALEFNRTAPRYIVGQRPSAAAKPIAIPAPVSPVAPATQDPWHNVWQNYSFQGAFPTGDVITTQFPIETANRIPIETPPRLPVVRPKIVVTAPREPEVTEVVRTTPAGSTAPIARHQEPRDERAASPRAETVAPRGPRELPPGYEKTWSVSGRTWNGCDRRAVVQGQYTGSRGCNTARLESEFAKQLNRYFVPCLKEGARNAGLEEPTSFYIRHMGTSGHSRNHSRERAMDLASVEFRDASGRQYFKFDTNVRSYPGRSDRNPSEYQQKNKIVYDTFRHCWKRHLPRPGCSVGTIGHTKCSYGYNNAAHNDHIHLEYDPRCGAAN